MAEDNIPMKIQKLRDLANACSAMGGYSPVQNAIQLASMNSKIASIDGLNTNITQMETLLNNKQEQRWLKVKGQAETDGSDGLIRRSRQIANYVDGLGETYEAETEQIRRFVTKMQPSQTRRKKLNETDRTRSTSEQSFASIINCAENIFNIIDTIPDYLPVDANIEKTNYRNLIDEVKNLSTDISNTQKDLRPVLKEREKQVQSKANGISRIIAETRKFVLGCYGRDSSEWNSIRLIKA